jgi:aspartyl-tRNA synthetase
MADVTEVFRGSAFAVFDRAIGEGAVVRAIPAPGAASQSRSFFDKMVAYAQEKLGLPGLSYLLIGEPLRGPLSKFVTPEMGAKLLQATGARAGDALFFVCRPVDQVSAPSAELRNHLGRELDLIEKKAYRFCWIVDFPFYELDKETRQIAFSHNPFSMPQGGLEALNGQDPLTIKAFQYDIVCNGVELSSGAIRNHRPDVMLRAFEIAGYPKETVERRFGGMLNAFRYGAPPHGGLAPGVDRIVMQIADEPNIREVIGFPLNQAAQDLLMNAPSEVTEKQLRELHIQVVLPPKR